MPQKPPRILVVDDHADIRRLILMTLEFENYDIYEAASGAQGWIAVQEFSPDVVVLDVMMPGMSGPDTLAALRLHPEMMGVPTVFLTAKATPNELEHLAQCGVTGVIVKPFDPMSLPANLRIYWEHGRGRS